MESVPVVPAVASASYDALRTRSEVARDRVLVDGVLVTDTLVGATLVSALVRPAYEADASGDWCDAFVVSPGLIALSIGDVAGHGAAAHATMLPLREIVRSAARAEAKPQEVLEIVNRAVLARETFATAIFGYFDAYARTFTFVNAGHPPPLLVTGTTAHFVRFERYDVLLGATDKLDARLRTIRVNPETLFVLYTDGVSERTRDPIAGENDLARGARDVFATSKLATAERIATHLDLDGSNHDDVAILTLSSRDDDRPWTARASSRRHRMPNLRPTTRH